MKFFKPTKIKILILILLLLMFLTAMLLLPIVNPPYALEDIAAPLALISAVIYFRIENNEYYYPIFYFISFLGLSYLTVSLIVFVISKIKKNKEYYCGQEYLCSKEVEMILATLEHETFTNTLCR